MTADLIHGDHISCSRVGGALRREAARLRRHAQSVDDALGDLAACSGPDPAVSAVSPVSDFTTGPGPDPAVSAVSAVNAVSPVSALAAGIAGSLRILRATTDDLDRTGAALQRYATDLAEGHELGRRAELRVEAAGLLLAGTRVIEPWGPASASDAERRRAELPEVQARVDLATAHVGRARGRLERELTLLASDFSRHSSEGSRPGSILAEPTWQTPLPR